jgi:uncharacterized RmlC-like cupin family protein
MSRGRWLGELRHTLLEMASYADDIFRTCYNNCSVGKVQAGEEDVLRSKTMSSEESEQSRHYQGVRVIKPAQFDGNTAQTPGMQRVAAVSRELAGSQGIWAGVTIVGPHVASGKHHHGELETVIYVVSGHGRIRWGEQLEFVEDVEPGDFIYVPPFVPHQEINPGSEPSQWVIVRNSQEPVVINLEPVDEEQQTGNTSTHTF